MTPNEQAERNSERLNVLESTLMHLQSDYDVLNTVVLENTQRLEDLRKVVTRLLDRIESAEKEEKPRRLEDEKPPHY